MCFVWKNPFENFIENPTTEIRVICKCAYKLNDYDFVNSKVYQSTCIYLSSHYYQHSTQSHTIFVFNDTLYRFSETINKANTFMNIYELTFVNGKSVNAPTNSFYQKLTEIYKAKSMVYA